MTKKPDPVVSESAVRELLGSLKVRLVDAEEVRGRSLDAQEFGNFGVHLQFPGMIPPGEVWVADAVPDAEQRFLLLSAANQLAAHAEGMNADDAYEYGLAAERAARGIDKASGGVRPYHDEVLKGVYLYRWGSVGGDDERCEVWVVNGVLVRGAMKTDFVEAGHSFVYPFLPEPEIWVEEQVRECERPVTVLHEYVERWLMKRRGMAYGQAHDVARRVEFAARKHHRETVHAAGSAPAVSHSPPFGAAPGVD